MDDILKTDGSVANGGEDVDLGESLKRVDRVERAPERLVENVANSRAATQLGRLDVLRRAVDRAAVGRGEARRDLHVRGYSKPRALQYLQKCLSAVGDRLAVRLEESVELTREHVHARLQLGQAVANVVHQ